MRPYNLLWRVGLNSSLVLSNTVFLATGFIGLRDVLKYEPGGILPAETWRPAGPHHTDANRSDRTVELLGTL